MMSISLLAAQSAQSIRGRSGSGLYPKCRNAIQNASHRGALRDRASGSPRRSILRATAGQALRAGPLPQPDGQTARQDVPQA